MLKYAIIELQRRKRRTIATVTGYLIAVVVFSIMLNVLFESQKASSAVLDGTGTHFIAYMPLCTNETCERTAIDGANEGFYADTVKTRLFSRPVIDIIKANDAVRAASPYLLFRMRQKINGVMNTFMLGGIPLDKSLSAANNSCSPDNIVQGRFLNPDDNESVILEEGFAKRYFLSVGSQMDINNKIFGVVGIVNSGIKPVKADIYMPLACARESVNPRLYSPMHEEFNIILVESLNSRAHHDAMLQVKRGIGDRGVISSYNCYKPAAEVLGINRTGALLITIIVFAGILGFSLWSQYASIVEKRYQIGILKSVGWSKSDILKELFDESMVQSLAGWAAGSIVAFAANTFISAIYFKRTDWVSTLPILLYSLFFSAAGGIIAGAVSGYSASRLRISDCLRKL